AVDWASKVSPPRSILSWLGTFSEMVTVGVVPLACSTRLYVSTRSTTVKVSRTAGASRSSRRSRDGAQRGRRRSGFCFWGRADRESQRRRVCRTMGIPFVRVSKRGGRTPAGEQRTLGTTRVGSFSRCGRFHTLAWGVGAVYEWFLMALARG